MKSGILVQHGHSPIKRSGEVRSDILAIIGFISEELWPEDVRQLMQQEKKGLLQMFHHMKQRWETLLKCYYFEKVICMYIRIFLLWMVRQQRV